MQHRNINTILDYERLGNVSDHYSLENEVNNISPDRVKSRMFRRLLQAY